MSFSNSGSFWHLPLSTWETYFALLIADFVQLITPGFIYGFKGPRLLFCLVHKVTLSSGSGLGKAMLEYLWTFLSHLVYRWPAQFFVSLGLTPRDWWQLSSSEHMIDSDIADKYTFLLLPTAFWAVSRLKKTDCWGLNRLYIFFSLTKSLLALGLYC